MLPVNNPGWANLNALFAPAGGPPPAGAGGVAPPGGGAAAGAAAVAAAAAPVIAAVPPPPADRAAAPIAAVPVAPPAPAAPAAAPNYWQRLTELFTLVPNPDPYRNLGELFDMPDENVIRSHLITRENCLTQLENLSAMRRAWLEPLRQRVKTLETPEQQREFRADVIRAMRKLYEIKKISNMCSTKYTLCQAPAGAADIKAMHERHDKATKEFNTLEQLESDIFLALQTKYNIVAADIDLPVVVKEARPMNPLFTIATGLSAALLTDAALSVDWKQVVMKGDALTALAQGVDYFMDSKGGLLPNLKGLPLAVATFGVLASLGSVKLQPKNTPIADDYDWAAKQVKNYANYAPGIGLCLAGAVVAPALTKADQLQVLVPAAAKVAAPIVAAHIAMYVVNKLHESAGEIAVAAEPTRRKNQIANRAAALRTVNQFKAYVRNGFVLGVGPAFLAGISTRSWTASVLTYIAHVYASRVLKNAEKPID